MEKTGWVMSVIFALFILIASAAPKYFGAKVAVDSMVTLGWSSRYLLLIGTVEVVGVILFLYPRTALMGAILLTGLFGGAIASKLRVDSPMFSHTLFGAYLGVFMYFSLWLRDPYIRKFLPLIRNPS